MAAKVLFFLATIAAVAYASDTDCNCDPSSELEDTALWEFLKQLSSEPADVTDNDRLDAVLPGELSPLLCNCNGLDTTQRKKRKILPEVVESTENDYNDEETQYELKRTPKCPEGYTWIGIMCALENRLMMDK